MAACIEGYNRAQGGEDSPPAMSAAEMDEMIARHAKIVTVH